MYLTGFADEAADSLAGQIRATRALGWKNIEARSVDGVNIHDLPEEKFEGVRRELDAAGIRVNCLGSTIANWGRKVDEPFEQSLEAVDRAVRRMKLLGTRLVRIMSYAVLLDADGRALPDQQEEERFRRLREIVRRFTGAGITPVHENCLNYGGMSAEHTLRMLENVPGLELVFDTGNPPLTPDFGRPFPYPMQNSWDFYRAVKDRIAYVHIKDARRDPVSKEEVYTFPGEGDGHVVRIVEDLLKSGYDGGFSMEPHMAVVFHDASVRSADDARFENYVEYGQRFMKILEGLGRPAAS
jgi:sugar phosphate isomerase/epimerase